MYGNRGTRPCRYGPSCRFLARGDCWFYHPDWHQTHTFVNTSYRQPQTSSRARLPTYRNSSFYDEQSDQEDNLFSFRTTHTRPSRSNNVESYNQLLRLLSILTLRSNKKKQQVQKKSEPVNIIETGKQVIVGKKMMNSVKIECKLQKSKSWYFQNCCHFQYQIGCLYEECAICLNKFQSKQIASELLCKHAFHTDCIQQWLKKSDNCPLCREDFKKHQQYKKMSGYPGLQSKLFSFNSMSRSLWLRQ